jgi:hypothetical protein
MAKKATAAKTSEEIKVGSKEFKKLQEENIHAANALAQREANELERKARKAAEEEE